MCASRWVRGVGRKSKPSIGMVLFSTNATNATIINGNSTTATPFNKISQLFKRKATILITDPPYCILQRKRTYGDIRGNKAVRSSKLEDAPEVPKFQSLSEYRQFSEKWIKAALNHGLVENSYMIIWTNTLGKSILVDTCASLGYNLIGEYVWAKSSKVADNSKLPPKYRFFHPISTTESEVLLRVYESALIFSPVSMTENVPDGWIRKRSSSANQRLQSSPDELILRDSLTWSVATSYHDTDVFQSPSSKSNITTPSEENPNKINKNIIASTPHQHPCHKPLSSLLPLLLNWTLPGDLILDPFTGSGGILSAITFLNKAQNGVQYNNNSGHVRQYAGIEILPNWAESSTSLTS